MDIIPFLCLRFNNLYIIYWIKYIYVHLYIYIFKEREKAKVEVILHNWERKEGKIRMMTEKIKGKIIKEII